ncbi:MAG: Rap1a/Tai family immunity protein [Alphaproteobacteria bacterium]|nr:Rap1a/Tai family immunity protein [Alphaproteobacteria bacterium]
MRYLTTLAAAALLAGSVGGAWADSFSGSAYRAIELLRPCQNADSDARDGAPSEIECEQYLMGFVDGLMGMGQIGPQTGLCPPAVNTADELRWSYMRWVHGNYSERKNMPAADAVLASIRENFPCE